MPDPRPKRDSRPLRWLERLFVIAGVAALMWCAVNVTDGAIAQWNAQSALEIALAVHEIAPPPLGTSTAAPSPHLPPDVGAVIAALSIPRVQLSAMVLHGSDALTLQRGPGHLEHTAFPGETGNIVIAGHRDLFFRPLRHIRLDDDIFLDTIGGQFHYRVTSIRVVGPRDVSVVATTSEEVLTLITCYPFWVLGHAPDRFIVRAARVEDGAPPLLEARSLPALGWLDAPVVHMPVRHSMALPAAAAAPDDETLVRQAVQRYLSLKGARLAACAVSITGDRASAGCDRAGHASKGEPGRVFALERANQGWSIRSIELTDRPAARDSQELP
jgi:sortase A